MTEYKCHTCNIITVVEDGEDWFKILTKHHLEHVGTKYGPSYEGRRFSYYYPRCARTDCKEIGTHTARSEFFGISYCDKHWKEMQTPEGQRILGNLLRE